MTEGEKIIHFQTCQSEQAEQGASQHGKTEAAHPPGKFSSVRAPLTPRVSSSPSQQFLSLFQQEVLASSWSAAVLALQSAGREWESSGASLTSAGQGNSRELHTPSLSQFVTSQPGWGREGSAKKFTIEVNKEYQAGAAKLWFFGRHRGLPYPVVMVINASHTEVLHQTPRAPRNHSTDRKQAMIIKAPLIPSVTEISTFILRSDHIAKKKQRLKLQTNKKTLENSQDFNEKSSCTG